MNFHFAEKQKFTQWYIWVIQAGLTFMVFFGLYKQLILKEAFGDKPMSDLGLVIFSVLMITFVFFFWYITLKTEITEKGIKMQFVPFVKKEINWIDIKSAEVVKYGFVGYGIRLGSKYGTVYNIKGNKGLAVQLKNGDKFLIGTQKQEEMAHVLAHYFPLNSN